MTFTTMMGIFLFVMVAVLTGYALSLGTRLNKMEDTLFEIELRLNAEGVIDIKKIRDSKVVPLDKSTRSIEVDRVGEEEDLELTNFEIKELKMYVEKYSNSKYDYMLNWMPCPSSLRTDKNPLQKYKFDNFIEQDFKWLQDLVLYPEKLEKEQEKIKLKKEIEEKEKELSEME